MSIHVALNHATHYRYDRLVHLGPQVVRLRPAPHSRTRILSYSLNILPENHFINWQQDPQSNYLARLVFPEPTREFRVEVDLVAEMAVLNPFDYFLEPGAEKFPFVYDNTLRRELTAYLVKLPASAQMQAYLDAIPRTPRSTNDFLVELNQRLAHDIRYLIRMEPGVQTPEQTLALAAGSCRDSAWLLVQLLRHLGLAARFVSGYLIQLTADVKALDGPSGPEADFTDLHAWCEVYLPGAGWIGLDPTSGLLAGEGHIPLACSPEPGSAAAVTGAVGQCEVEFAHSMQVTRLVESPRVTKPYTFAQWDAIEALGHKVDADLQRLDVRLTMGGEPTFVAADDPDGAEWNIAAMGPTKRLRAAELYHRLRDKYAPQGLVHFGQGKWYPGEQLPRWSLNCFWRRDGEPIWRDPALIADEKHSGKATSELGATLLAEVASRLHLDAGYVFPAFEDLFYYLWRERRLPENVDPSDPRLDDALERERLMRIFSQGLDHVAGHIFPLAKPLGTWQTGPWFLRSEHCYLVPGDSAMGYRLPLDSQPWAKESDYPFVHPADPSQTFKPLPAYTDIRRQFVGIRRDEPTTRHSGESRAFNSRMAGHPASLLEPSEKHKALDPGLRRDDEQRKATGETRAPQPGESGHWITRTALCAEARNGNLYLFMPPLARLEDYLELTNAIEDAAAALGTPVLLEGYEPPRDPRLNSFRVTPDPGVIEVNIHPSENWDQLVDRTTHLYEAARQTKLSAEKFMVDGRHTGTGGGNHFVLGGATTQDSPFLRRPDLLRSLLAYWHNHPALSYLFSGLFIGPTSQAPRVDEARNDALYELEIAFRQFPDAGGYVPPWLLDRLLRNLLIDVTGNTHRSEFCIDKLYSPDGAAGRLGLVEMRAFEMPPHAQMSLAQQMLLRALIARFWKTPYQPQRLARWGTELHDHFMLPHFIEQDFADVIAETRSAGYAVERDWFAPHFEFRFPKIGDFDTRGIALELRHALEPWHVMGEEGAAGGAVRYVDSSVERLQIKLSGLAPDRYVATCNGKSVPLRPTGTVGEFVGGVRYKAWSPPSALHPTIPAHPPLRFDLVDTWSRRSLGGCQYHVAHPGGRSDDTFPINAFEAESRRLARFFRFGHTPGRIDAQPTVVNADFPFTLDLRGS